MFSIAGVFMLYAWQASVIWLLLIRLMQGIAEAPIWVNAQTAIADLSPREKRGRAMGMYGSSWALGFAVGPLAGGLLYSIVGAGGSFLISGLLAIVGAIIIMGTFIPKPKVTFEKTSLEGLWRPCLVGFVYLGIVGLILTLFPPYGRELGITSAGIGGLITLFGVLRATLFLPMGNIADKFGYRNIILIGLAGVTIASLGIGFFSNPILLLLAIALLAWGGGAIYPAAVSMASEVGKGKNRGYVLGIFNAASMAGWGILATGGGGIADTFGSTTPYFMCAILALGILLILWKVLPRR
ncbi:hypothetical protein AKJ47_00900 [candidate division MSBL1 archaeon SCGC-AAA261G05]|uniref:Major facilitator superfamily (MFS) profile domain-containing protein n=1 Tax=candidate division MSBL1 archaeon SCGC-AAA261G05 TaxID=1698276 RepID=A0A133VCA6_9EURY|nr:hypothetical protein AKJ47_00900 [candidate division MSBL1 archaeon SCGC-AAA261G05]